MKGEIISLIVAVSWTITALCAEYASKHIGQLATNVIRMAASLVLLSLTMLIVTGSPLPLYADGNTWLWLSLSGFVGYCFGDYCLFNSYIVMGSRYGQLFMTLAPPVAAISSWLIFGETMTPLAILGMFITILGIALSIFGKEDKTKKSTPAPQAEAPRNPTFTPRRKPIFHFSFSLFTLKSLSEASSTASVQAQDKDLDLSSPNSA